MGTISTHSKREGTSSSLKKQETYAARTQAILRVYILWTKLNEVKVNGSGAHGK